jgi:hypothetical protein
MNIKNMIINSNWSAVKDIALNTIGKSNVKNVEPSSAWKRKILLSEHSPIRYFTIKWMWENIPYFVSVHLSRHKFGIEHFVKTQRSDRTNIDRNKLPQNNLVSHTCIANAQAIINISRKRLCYMTSAETREAWQSFIDSFKEEQPELHSVCVPDCIYRGWCYEFKSCGYSETKQFINKLNNYRKGDYNE